MRLQIRLCWKYIAAPPTNGVFADLREWVRDAGIASLDAALRELVRQQRGKVLTHGAVVNMAETLWQFVKDRQREEYNACRTAAADGDFDKWLQS